MPSTNLQRADEILQEGLAGGIYSAVAYAVAREGQILGQKALGRLSFEKDAKLATLKTIFDMASLTKPMATATSILQLVERGDLHLKQPVGQFFEDDFGPLAAFNGVEVHHLLTHTAGLAPIPQMSLSVVKCESERKALVAEVLSTPPLRPAGEGFTYSDTGYILLGEIVARVAGKSLPAWFVERIARPLGLSQKTRFLPDSTDEIALTDSEAVPGVVHDPRARALGGVAGHAGLFSTVDDLMRYAEAIRAGGAPILSPVSQARMAESQIPASVGAHSYGWFCAGNDYLPSGDLFSDKSYGHTGFTGCVLLIDPTYEISLVLLTNRVLNSSEDGARFLALRRRWLNSVAAAATAA